jgi:hypothetical protein
MGSKSKQTSSQTQTTSPDALTDQWRQQIFNQGNALQGQPTPQYQVAPMSDMTQQGLQGMSGYASGGIPQLGQAYGANQRQMSGYNPATGMAAGIAQGGLSNNPWQSAFAGYGQGSNQYAQGLFNQASGDIGNAVNAQFASSGRYGGNAARTDSMTRGIGNAWNQIMTPVYENERNRGLTAAQTGASLWESGADRATQGVGMLGSLYNTGIDQSNRAIGNVSSLFQTGAMPYQMLADVGGAYDAQNQAELDAQYQNQNAPWDRYLQYSQVLQGLPLFGTTTGTGTTRTRGSSFGWNPQSGFSFGG